MFNLLSILAEKFFDRLYSFILLIIYQTIFRIYINFYQSNHFKEKGFGFL